MEEMIVSIIVAIFGSTGLFTFLWNVISDKKSRIKEVDLQTQIIVLGLCELLWRELKTIHREAEEKGGMTIDERQHLEQVYESYHSLGGNGTGTRLYDDAMKLRVIE